MPMNRLTMKIATLTMAALMATGCAASRNTQAGMPTGDEAYAGAVENDPIEPFNRAMYRVNEVVDFLIIKPVTYVYRAVLPQPVRTGVSNVLRNLTEPVTMANAILQGDPDRAFTALWRFVLNSTYGFAGIRDFAGENGLAYRGEDFGQTLGTYGAGPGFYLFLPVIGPLNGRDAIGKVVDVFSDPTLYVLNDYQNGGLYVVRGIDARSRNWERLEELKKTSLDPYATIRSAYTQRRASEIRNGNSSREGRSSF